MSAIEDITNSPLGQYQKRKGVYPKAVDGPFRRLKWAIMAATLAIYYITPWIRWDRGPYAPDQAVLVDLANRRFYMFGIEIWPHEFYYVAGLLIMAGVGLFLVTSAVGRAWCGYACPQTVWTDLYQHVERFIDGDRNAQVRLAHAPWGPAKLGKRLSKWAIWLVIAFWTGGAWIMYFADAPTLVRDFWTGNAAPVAYATVGVLTLTTFILGGFMREQVCIYMCPWPRIQTAMLDERSLTVTYKDWRGEQRGSLKAAQAHPGDYGDCVDCNQCVSVCPTGIDIREGPQIGCITCALCIDACDSVMAQVGRPRGLIDYATLADADKEKRGESPTPVLRTLLRPRTLIYFGIWAGIGLGLLFALGNRTRIDISASHERNPVYVQLSNGDVRNSYTLRLRNMETRPRRMEVGLTGLEQGRIWLRETRAETAARALRVQVPADSVAKLSVFAVAPQSGPPSEGFAFTVRALDAEGGADSHSVSFERPERQP
ncbi:MAG: cytochrome c oxidase accessory protein CcoG [Sphingopyxis sp.]|nr:cytochrome c oxidase accessory protein CcoG [Sphingopyxis sp.]